jgi:hypothetical protein
VIGAREQAKATALIGALSPAAVEGGDTTVTATLVDAGALIGDAVDGVAGAVDRVILEASGPVLGLGNTVGGTGGVVTSTTDAVLGQGTGDFVGGSGGGGVASGGSGLRSTVGGATGGGLSSGGGSFTGGGLTSGDGGLSGGSLTSGGGGLSGREPHERWRWPHRRRGRRHGRRDGGGGRRHKHRGRAASTLSPFWPGYNVGVKVSLLAVGISMLVVTAALPGAAQDRVPANHVAPRVRPPAAVRGGDAQGERLERLAAEVVRTTRNYRASLERMLIIYQRDAESMTELVEARRDLLQREIISKREVEIAEGLLAETQAKVAETERWIQDADKIIGEAAVHSEMSKLPPMTAGGYLATTAFIRFNGSAPFSLADLPRVGRFFAGRFGRSIPISALGQSAAHDRIGFDHRNAVDVAVHPESAEGQALMGYLQSQNIPFVAVRQAVPGSATGAHIHIGQPSRRITARP